MFALVQAAGLVDTHPTTQIGSLGRLLQRCVNFISAAVRTRGARRAFWPLIGTDKNMMFKDGQLGSILLPPD
jgi:hypothetical protein